MPRSGIQCDLRGTVEYLCPGVEFDRASAGISMRVGEIRSSSVEQWNIYAQGWNSIALVWKIYTREWNSMRFAWKSGISMRRSGIRSRYGGTVEYLCPGVEFDAICVEQ